MGSTIHPVIGGFTDVVESSAQLIKFIKPGDSDAINIPIYIYAKPYTGTGVFQHYFDSGTDTTFKDDALINVPVPASGGDMPIVAASPNNAANKAGFLVVDFADTNSSNVFNAGDKYSVRTGVVHNKFDPTLTQSHRFRYPK